MRIALEDIPRNGRTLPFHLDQEVERGMVADAVEGELTALEGTLKVVRGKSSVTVFVTGTAQAHRPCDRCGDDVTYGVEVDTSLVYNVPTSIPSGEYELSEDELDVGFLEEDAVVTEHVLSEAFALAAPVRVTCAGDACAATDPVGTQFVDDDVAPSPFAALKDLF